MSRHAMMAGGIQPVIASDSVDLPGGTCIGLLCGTGGLATIVDAGGITRTGVPLQPGYNPIACKRVFATGLLALNIWALYRA